MDRVRKNVERIKTQIAPYNPTIVAVTKYFDESQILKYYEIGFRDFGENRVKDAVEKIKKLRLEYAANELRTTDLPVSAICYRSGFNDISYFCRSFLAFHGCTPKNYRDKIGQY